LIFAKSLIKKTNVKIPHAVPNMNAALSSSPREKNAFMIGQEKVHAPSHAQMLYTNMAPLLPPVLGKLISPFSFSTATIVICDFLFLAMNQTLCGFPLPEPLK